MSRTAAEPRITVRDLSLWYDDDTQALKNVSFDLYPDELLAFIGPSGCGKTTALKCLNRMHDDDGIRIEGTICMEGQDIHAPDIDPPMLRRRFGWVAQKPNPFVSSIYDNVAYGARLHGLFRSPGEIDDHVEKCLQRADLWDEVKDELHTKNGFDLSGGQQQRLCIARALSTNPDVLLMDEPTGSIDPIATAHVEDLMMDLKKDHSVIVVTHSMMQAKRVADRVAHFHLGELVTLDDKDTVFSNPDNALTKDFIEGAFG